MRSRRAWPHRRRHTGREGGRRRPSRASGFTIEVGPTTKLHEHTEDTARAGKRAQGGHVHRWRDVRAQRKHARGAHRSQACARTLTTHCCRVLGAALELAPPPTGRRGSSPPACCRGSQEEGPRASAAARRGARCAPHANVQARPPGPRRPPWRPARPPVPAAQRAPLVVCAATAVRLQKLLKFDL